VAIKKKNGTKKGVDLTELSQQPGLWLEPWGQEWGEKRGEKSVGSGSTGSKGGSKAQGILLGKNSYSRRLRGEKDSGR